MDALTKEVLAYCNSIRSKLDLPEIGYIVPGRLAVAHSCPIARTIVNGSDYRASTFESCMVAYPEFGVGNYVLIEDTPKYVRRWIFKFDDGEYSDYIIHS